MQAQAYTANIALYTNTTNQPEVPLADPVQPERAHYFDVGIDHRLLPGLDVGIDGYYKVATDMIDDGQFGQAVVLTQFNWARGYSEGVEFKAKYQNGNFKSYANFSYGIAKAIGPVSNQYVLDADEYAYLVNHYHYTDDMQRMTGSAGASYRWDNTLFSANMIYGSGLRSGFANIDHTPAYAVVNLGVSREFQLTPSDKPITARFDIVNALDQVYELRNGTGIGVFAPQYGARRGFYFGLSQKVLTCRKPCRRPHVRSARKGPRAERISRHHPAVDQTNLADIFGKAIVIIRERLGEFLKIGKRIFHLVVLILNEILGTRIRRLMHRFDRRRLPQNPIGLDRVQRRTGDPCRMRDIMAEPVHVIWNP